MSEVLLLVGDPAGLHSSSWKVQAQNGSFYLMPRTARGACKVTVHPPTKRFPNGSCWFGATEDWLKRHPGGMLGDKVGRLQRYFPRARGPGITRVAALRVDHRAVKLKGAVSKAPSHYVLQPPPPGGAAVVEVVLIHDPAQAATWWEQDGFVVAIVDESELGDLALYVTYQDSVVQAVYIDSLNTPEEKAELLASSVVVAFDIDPADGAVVVDEVPVLPGPPPPETQLLPRLT